MAGPRSQPPGGADRPGAAPGPGGAAGRAAGPPPPHPQRPGRARLRPRAGGGLAAVGVAGGERRRARLLDSSDARTDDSRIRPEDLMSLVLLPAVDVADGQAVRLVQGEAGTETGYGEPLAAALAWQEAGAEWIHLVDLDAAFGRGSNRELITEMVGRLDVNVELSGGIRDDESLAAALATGCRRVSIGTAAPENPEWCRKIIAEHGDKIAVGLAVRGTTLASRGWTQDAGDLWEVLDRLEADGCPRYVVTDVTKDGTLKGPNLELLKQVCARTDRPVVASDGNSSLDDMAALASIVPDGVEGAIVVRALYAQACTQEIALATVRDRK